MGEVRECLFFSVDTITKKNINPSNSKMLPIIYDKS